MQTIHERTREQLPSVLLTLLSIIQALALELFWSEVSADPALRSWGWAAVLGWAQVSVLLIGIVLIWLFYSTMVMRFVWTPKIVDLVMPFPIGLIEFWMVDALGPDTLGLWFFALALAFAVVPSVSYTLFRRARRDPANREFFETVDRATLRDFAPTIATVGALLLFAVLLEWTGNRTWLAVLCTCGAGAALVLQIVDTRRAWDSSVRGNPDAAC